MVRLSWLVAAAAVLVIVSQVTVDLGGRTVLYGDEDIGDVEPGDGVTLSYRSEHSRSAKGAQMLSQGKVPSARKTKLINSIGQAISSKWLEAQGSPVRLPLPPSILPPPLSSTLPHQRLERYAAPPSCGLQPR